MATRPGLDEITKLAFADELVKISRTAEQTANRQQASRWIKNTLLISGGAAAGIGLGMIAERLGPKLAGSAWRNMSPERKVSIIGPVIGISSAAMPFIVKALVAERDRRMREG